MTRYGSEIFVKQGVSNLYGLFHDITQEKFSFHEFTKKCYAFHASRMEVITCILVFFLSFSRIHAVKKAQSRNHADLWGDRPQPQGTESIIDKSFHHSFHHPQVIWDGSTLLGMGHAEGR